MPKNKIFRYFNSILKKAKEYIFHVLRIAIKGLAVIAWKRSFSLLRL
jgi:hypothetical protein